MKYKEAKGKKMTPEEAIKVFESELKWAKLNKYPYVSKQKIEADKMAIKILKQEPCEVVISREAVLDEINRVGVKGFETYNDYSQLYDFVDTLPSINPQPKTGHWIDTGSGQECSVCGEIQHGYDNFRYFCPNCGAKMVEPQESEDKE